MTFKLVTKFDFLLIHMSTAINMNRPTHLKTFKYLTAEDLRDQLGTMLGTRVTSMRDNEVMVKLDDGRKVITKKQYFLFNKR